MATANSRIVKMRIINVMRVMRVLMSLVPEWLPINELVSDLL